MDKSKRHMAEGWHDTASNHLATAKKHLEGRVDYSGAVQAAQVCVELSVKSVLTFLNIEFAREHGWEREKFGKIAEQIQKRRILDKLAEKHIYIKLPRLLFLANFWDQFYLTAKYGMETGYLASAQDLFEHSEAELAVKHADECESAAARLRYLPEEELTALVK